SGEVLRDGAGTRRTPCSTSDERKGVRSPYERLRSRGQGSRDVRGGTRRTARGGTRRTRSCPEARRSRRWRRQGFVVATTDRSRSEPMEETPVARTAKPPAPP